MNNDVASGYRVCKRGRGVLQPFLQVHTILPHLLTLSRCEAILKNELKVIMRSITTQFETFFHTFSLYRVDGEFVVRVTACQVKILFVMCSK